MSGLRIVDAHHHLIDFDNRLYPWLSPRPARPSMIGDVTSIARPYLLDDYRADFEDLNVVKSVHVEAGFDPKAPVDETRWLQGIADANGFPHAIVAKIEMQSDDAEKLMDQHKAYANVRGIRHMINWHDDPAKTYSGEKFLENDRWLANYGLLAKYGYSFDLQIYPRQMREAAALVARHPDIPVVLDHSGMPVDREEEEIAIWREGIMRLAALPHVMVKLSGLGMVDHKWTIESLRPFVLFMIDAFGPKRAMFGSNFPVDRLYSSYDTLVSAFDTITCEFSDDERADLFAGTAERFYRI